MDDNALYLAYEYLKLIWDISVDCDGFNTVESLKELVDEMAYYTKEAMKMLSASRKSAGVHLMSGTTGKNRISCLGYIDRMTDDPIPEFISCHNHVSKAEDERERFYRENRIPNP